MVVKSCDNVDEAVASQEIDQSSHEISQTLLCDLIDALVKAEFEIDPKKKVEMDENQKKNIHLQEGVVNKEGGAIPEMVEQPISQIRPTLMCDLIVQDLFQQENIKEGDDNKGVANSELVQPSQEISPMFNPTHTSVHSITRPVHQAFKPSRGFAICFRVPTGDWRVATDRRVSGSQRVSRLPVFIRSLNTGSSPNHTQMKKQQNDGLYTYKILLCKKFGLVKGVIAESLVSERKLHWRSYRLCGFGANLCSKNSPANLYRKFERVVHTGPEFSRDFLVQLWVADGLHGSSVTRNGHYDHRQGATQSLEYASPEEALIAPLLSRSNLIITRDIEWANLTLGFEQENRYAIVDVSNPQVPAGFIREESNVIARQLLRKRRPFVATITDAYGNELFKVRRPFWWITSSIYAEVGGKEIGVVHRRWHLWKRIYDLYLGNEQFAVVDNWDFWFWTFTLKGINGEVLAEINRDWRGFGFKVFTDAGQYVIRFGSASGMPVELSKKVEEFDVARPLTLLERAVTVALAVSLDNDYFSRHGGWGEPFFVAAE
ncbi:hypothetical protein E3N88_38971 [Mikania micrantha]|uniref:Phospholipid scramblase n=1 Tax=Mikania micrantha TaxID=192012 RepID=A0A5N6LVF6_9ASTR|nr:hypothetical protein E3N88_38971 [Mikania micrantha]